jgi:hypothetical protein
MKDGSRWYGYIDGESATLIRMIEEREELIEELCSVLEETRIYYHADGQMGKRVQEVLDKVKDTL